jgi:hypothetical protein
LLADTSEKQRFIPMDKSERTRKLLEQARELEKKKKRFINEGKTYRGILTHAVEGDKKGYHVEWNITEITSTHVSGIFSIMLVSCKNGNAATLKTFPCKLNLSMKISDIVNLDEFADVKNVLKGLNQQSFLDDLFFVTPPTDAEDEVSATPTVNNATQTPTVVSSSEMFSHFENSQFSRIIQNSSNQDSSPTSPEQAVLDSEDEAIETQWLSDHIPLTDSQISIVRLGNVLAGFFNTPKVGVFYLSIQ